MLSTYFWPCLRETKAEEPMRTSLRRCSFNARRRQQHRVAIASITLGPADKGELLFIAVHLPSSHIQLCLRVVRGRHVEPYCNPVEFSNADSQRDVQSGELEPHGRFFLFLVYGMHVACVTWVAAAFIRVTCHGGPSSFPNTAAMSLTPPVNSMTKHKHRGYTTRGQPKCVGAARTTPCPT